MNRNRGFASMDPQRQRELAAARADELRAAAQRLLDSHKNSTPGEWRKGISTHHTVTDNGYRIAEFHHADDAQFCDDAHKLVPLLCAAILTKG